MKLPETPYLPPPRFVWPGNARGAFMPCFDVDGETTALSENSAYADRCTLMSQCRYGPEVGVPRILELLAHYDVRGTFFIPSYIVETHPGMARTVRDQGHELGLHGHLHEKLAGCDRQTEAAILDQSLDIFDRVLDMTPCGYRAPWFEINPWTPELLASRGLIYDASLMGDDVPSIGKEGLVEIPGQWMLEDWEQFAFHADPAFGLLPEDTEKVDRLWWEEIRGLRDFGCCAVLTLHPWLSGRPSRIRLLETILRRVIECGDFWIATGGEIADHVRTHPDARREINLDAGGELSIPCEKET